MVRHSPVAPEKPATAGAGAAAGGSSAQALGVATAAAGKSIDHADEVISGAGAASAREVSIEIHSSQDLLAKFQGKAADAPMCMTCGTKMRPAGSYYVCEGCGSTSGCS